MEENGNMAKIDKYSMISHAFDVGQFDTAALMVVKREYVRRGIPENDCLRNLRSAAISEQKAVSEKRMREGVWNK
jgi:hypothetical protein